MGNDDTLQPLRVLLLEDNADDAELMLHKLEEAGFDPTWDRVETEVAFRARLADDLDVILADYTLPQFNALQALECLKESRVDVPLIVVTGTVSEEVAVACMKQGAADYLLKDRLARLGPAVDHALEQRRLHEEKRRAEAALLESEEAYRLLFENNPHPMWVYDPATTRFLEVNDAAIATYGYRRDTFLQMTLFDLHPEDDHERLQRHLDVPGLVWHEQAWVQRQQDGTPIEVELAAHALPFFGQEAVLVVAQDVTERNRVGRENKRLVEELRALSIELQQTEETERHRIAQDLHDEVGGLLTSLQIAFALSEEQVTSAPLLQEAATLVDTLQQKVRQVIYDLRPSQLGQFGLVSVLNTFFGQYTARTAIAVDFQTGVPEDARFAPATETAAFRIVQEALTNVARHAGVEAVQARLRQDANRLTIDIIDAGCGFDPDAPPGRVDSRGLLGMQERAQLLGGSLSIDATPGQGTHVTAVLPLEKNRQD